MTTTQIFHDSERDLAHRTGFIGSRIIIYGLLILWAVICLFPIYWTASTSLKIAPNVMQGHLVPWVDYEPKWLGWKSLGLSPQTISQESTVREEFVKRFTNSTIAAVLSSALAVVLGSMAAYGLSRFEYRFGFMRNSDISFSF